MRLAIGTAAAMIAAAACSNANSQVIINEVFENPQGSGSTDDRNEFIELYGRPGMDLTGYAVALAKGGFDNNGDDIPDDTSGDEVPEIDEAFSLDGWSIGPDGFFVLVNTTSTGVTDHDDDLIPNPDFDGNPLNESPTNKRWLNGASFRALHIPTTDTAGKLNNDGSSTYILVRKRPNHSIVNGESVYDPGYAWRKEPNQDTNFDGKLDFGTEMSLPGFPPPSAFEPYQMVDDLAWSNEGGKEYVRSSEQELSETPGFNPDAVSRLEYYCENPMRGHRSRDDGMGGFTILGTRTADESFVHGEVMVSTYEFIDDVDTAGCYQIKAPTDLGAVPYDGSCDPEPDTGCLPDPNDPTPPTCAPTPGGSFFFDDLYVGGMTVTVGDFNDHPTDTSIAQFSFDFPALPTRTKGFVIPKGDFNMDGVVDDDDLTLIQGRLGASLDDTQTATYDNATPNDPSDDYTYDEWTWQGKEFQQLLMMLEMDMTDGAGGENAPTVTQSDVDAVDALIPCDGDVDASGQVDASDISFIIFRLGDTGTPGEVDGDADGNGTVNTSDISYVIFRLGSC